MAEKKNKLQFGLDQSALNAIDWDLARARVEHDLKSDFIYAPHYSVIFRRAFEELRDALTAELSGGTFSPSLPHTIDVPKSSRMRVKVTGRLGPSFSRPGSILGPRDRLLYQALADQAAPIVDSFIDKTRSFSHWLKSASAEEMFLPTRDCWNRMHEALLKHAADTKWNYVVKLDVSNCFASINLHTLVNFLRELGYRAELTGVLENLLVHHTGTRSSRGVIQGVYPSDLLGNFYLSGVDQAFSDANLPSVRYVDDIYLFASTLEDAERLTRKAIAELRKYDLTLNEAKSYVLPKNLLITEEPDLEVLFKAAMDEVQEKLSEEDVQEEYGFQQEWEDEDEDEDEEGSEEHIELRATETLFDGIGEFKGNEEKIERFCLPLFAKARSAYAIDHVIKSFHQSPSMAQIYCAYMGRFIDQDEIKQRIEQMFLTGQMLFDWQRMWLLAALLLADAGSEQVIKSCLMMLESSVHHEALKAVAAIYVAKFGSYVRRKSLTSAYASVGNSYIQTAILYGARYFSGVEKRNAIAAWGPHSELHRMIAGSIAGG